MQWTKGNTKSKRYYQEYLESMKVQDLQVLYNKDKATLKAILHCLSTPEKHPKKELENWKVAWEGFNISIPMIKGVIASKAMMDAVVS